LAIERAGQPVAEVDHLLDRVAGRLAVDVDEFVAKGEIVGWHRHGILGAPRWSAPKAPRVLRKAADSRNAVSTKIPIHPASAADQLVQHHVDIDVQPAGVADRDRTLQLLASAESGLD